MKGLVGFVMAMVVGVAAAGAIAQGGQAAASTATALPTLNVEQKQAIQILAQRIELAQLRAQAAQGEFNLARGELATLLQSLQKQGFDLDLQAMAYVKKPESKAPEKKKDEPK